MREQLGTKTFCHMLMKLRLELPLLTVLDGCFSWMWVCVVGMRGQTTLSTLG